MRYASEEELAARAKSDTMTDDRKTRNAAFKGAGESPCSAFRDLDGEKRQSGFRRDIETLLNSRSMEQGSNTPDFILADYLLRCLQAFDAAVLRREQWYGRGLLPPEAPSGNVPNTLLSELDNPRRAKDQAIKAREQ